MEVIEEEPEDFLSSAFGDLLGEAFLSKALLRRFRNFSEGSTAVFLPMATVLSS